MPTATPEAAFPNNYEALLISYAHPDYQDSCVRYSPTYPTELASIACGLEDLPVYYTLFATLSDMAAGYNGDLDLGDFPPQQDGTCAEANYEAAYTIDDEEAGRVSCRQHTSSRTGVLYHDIEWTHDELLVLGYISNRADLRTWDELIDFWIEKSGPFTP